MDDDVDEGDDHGDKDGEMEVLAIIVLGDGKSEDDTKRNAKENEGDEKCEDFPFDYIGGFLP